MNKLEITQEAANDFDMVYPMLDTMFEEFKELSKKKQDGPLNAMKVKMINRILIKCKAILTNDPTIDFLDLLDEELLPTNSDVVLIIAQFKAAMKQFKDRHYTYNGYRSSWNVPNEDDDEEYEDEYEEEEDDDDDEEEEEEEDEVDDNKNQK